MTDNANSTQEFSKSPGKRLSTVKQIVADPQYRWVSEAFLRHAIFKAETKTGSDGSTIAGNGLSSAIVRLGRKVLIDLDEFDSWVEQHRMSPRASSQSPDAE